MFYYVRKMEILCLPMHVLGYCRSLKHKNKTRTFACMQITFQKKTNTKLDKQIKNYIYLLKATKFQKNTYYE